MAINRSIVQKAPKYEAHIEVDGTTIAVHLVGEKVAFRRAGGRAIIFVAPDEWPAFKQLVAEADTALMEKLALEAQTPALPEP